MKTIRLLLVADTHLGLDYPIRPRVQRRRRGQDFFDLFEKVLAYAAEYRVDFVVHGGDFFFRSKLPKPVVDLGYKILLDFAPRGIPFILVPGNHERSKLPDSLVLSHPNIHVFNKPKTFRFQVSGTHIAFSGFPFERKDIRTRFHARLDETDWRHGAADINFLCLHQAVEGAKVGPANFTFRHGPDVIQINDIPSELTAVLCGHIHRKQVLYAHGSDGKYAVPIIYPGSIERTSFAEKDVEKGFFVITLHDTDGETWRIQQLEFNRLSSRPMVDLHLDGDVNIENLKSFLQAHISCMNPDAIVRLKCGSPIDDQVKEALTSSYLRSIFPETMNVQLSASFFRGSVRK